MRYIILCAVLACMNFTVIAQPTNAKNPKAPTQVPVAGDWLSYTDSASGLSVKYPVSWRLKTTNPKAPIVLHAPTDGDNDTFTENINYITREIPAGQQVDVQDIVTAMSSNLSNQIDDFVMLSEKKLTWLSNPAVEIIYSGMAKGATQQVKILQRMVVAKGHLVLATYTAENGKTDTNFADAVKIIDQTGFKR